MFQLVNNVIKTALVNVSYRSSEQNKRYSYCSNKQQKRSLFYDLFFD